jgi:hypothetical protein
MATDRCCSDRVAWPGNAARDTNAARVAFDVVPADAFYERKVVEGGKQAYAILATILVLLGFVQVSSPATRTPASRGDESVSDQYGTVDGIDGTDPGSRLNPAGQCGLTILMPCLNEAETLARCIRAITLEIGLIIGAALILLGLGLGIYAIITWGSVAFGALVSEQAMRVVIPSGTAILLGFHIAYGAFFVSVLGIDRK